MIPILASALGSIAAKLGMSLATSAAKRLSGSSAPSSATPRRSFAEELDRAQPSATPAPAIASDPGFRSTAAGPVPLTTDPARLALSTRSGGRRAWARMPHARRHHVGAYRRMDVGPR